MATSRGFSIRLRFLRLLFRLRMSAEEEWESSSGSWNQEWPDDADEWSFAETMNDMLGAWTSHSDDFFPFSDIHFECIDDLDPYEAVMMESYRSN